MKLGKRLKTVADLVTGCRGLIDVGCDHAFLPIYLVENKSVKFALACDIAKGPLEIAKSNIRQHSLEEKVRTVLSSGLENVDVHGYDSLTICGMGGITILEILSKSIDKIRKLDRIIISPQSEEEELILGLNELKLNVIDEKFIEDRGKFYHILVLENGENEYFYGKFLAGNEIYVKYLDNKIKRLESVTKKFLEKDIPIKLKNELLVIKKRRNYASKGYN